MSFFNYKKDKGCELVRHKMTCILRKSVTTSSTLYSMYSGVQSVNIVLND